MTDDDLLARLKDDADAAWLKAHRLGQLQLSGLLDPGHWQRAIARAEEATARYRQALLAEVRDEDDGPEPREETCLS